MLANRSKLILAGMSILIVGGGTGYVFGSKNSSSTSTLVSKSEAVRVEVSTLAPRAKVDVEQRIQGKIEPVYQAKMGTALNGMYLDTLMVKEGDFVKKGQALAKLKTDLTGSTIASAKLSVERSRIQGEVLSAQLREATLNAKQAQEQFDRATQLQTVGSVSQEAVRIKEVEAKASVERLNVLQAQIKANAADIKSAQLSLQDAGIRQGYATLTAPFDGTIVAVKGAIGEVVSGEVVQVQSAETRAIFKVSASALADNAVLKINSKSYVPQLATVNNITSMYVPYDLGRTGQGVQGVLTYTYEGVKVPSASLVKKEGKWIAWFAVQGKEGWKAKSSSVEVAPIIGSEAVITSAIPSSKLITSGVDYLQENQKINF
jgi:multidrug efflux pump subunit AcrA (membrane-fusion protein)